MKKNYILLLITLLMGFTANAQVTLTQSIDPVNVTDGGVACWSSGSGQYRDNSFYRAYNLADFGVTGDFIISSLEYGQGSADAGKVITLNIYTASAENLSTAVLTLIQSATHVSAEADDLTLVSVPMTATIPANSIIAFEVFAADGGTAIGQTFFPGVNAAGQNDPSYLKATVCGIAIPTNTATVNAASQYVMNVIGNDALSVDEFHKDQSVSMFPNPASNMLNFNLKGSTIVKTIEIHSLAGQLIYKGDSSSSIDISNFQAGVYMVSIETQNGLVSKKLIKG